MTEPNWTNLIFLNFWTKKVIMAKKVSSAALVYIHCIFEYKNCLHHGNRAIIGKVYFYDPLPGKCRQGPMSVLFVCLFVLRVFAFPEIIFIRFF